MAGDRHRSRANDDGVGFDPTEGDARRGHWGLVGMRERAARLGGDFHCDTAGGRGTGIRVRIPSYRAYQKASRLMFYLRGLLALHRDDTHGRIVSRTSV